MQITYKIPIIEKVNNEIHRLENEGREPLKIYLDHDEIIELCGYFTAYNNVTSEEFYKNVRQGTLVLFNLPVEEAKPCNK